MFPPQICQVLLIVEGRRAEVLHLKVTLHEGHLQQLAS